jgi:heme-degrading monooxygenase HmoA
MFAATFTFAKGDYDDEFHQRDLAIAEAARSIPGYLGEEAWENPASGLISTVYYWETLEGLQQLIEHPMHVAAKQRQGRWLKGYHVTIAQVLKSYGDGGIAHPLAPTSNGHASPSSGRPGPASFAGER